MGFESAPTRSRTDLPEDLPDPIKASQEHKAGTAYRSDDGYLYRLVHPTWRLDARANRKVNGKELPNSSPQAAAEAERKATEAANGKAQTAETPATPAPETPKPATPTPATPTPAARK